MIILHLQPMKSLLLSQVDVSNLTIVRSNLTMHQSIKINIHANLVSVSLCVLFINPYYSATRSCSHTPCLSRNHTSSYQPLSLNPRPSQNQPRNETDFRSSTCRQTETHWSTPTYTSGLLVGVVLSMYWL